MVSLLTMVTVAQARRIAAPGESAVTITRADIPDQLDVRFRSKDYWHPGQYLEGPATRRVRVAR